MTRIPGWGSPSIKSSRSAQPPATDPAATVAGRRCCGSGCQVPGSCHHRRNQPHAVISDDRELVLLRVRSAAPLINPFSAGDLFVRCLVLIHSPSPSRLSSSRICRNCRLRTGSYLICRRISDDEDQIGKSQLFIEINIAVLFEMMIGYNMCATFYCILQVVMLSRCTTIYENFNRVREWLLCVRL